MPKQPTPKTVNVTHRPQVYNPKNGIPGPLSGEPIRPSTIFQCCDTNRNLLNELADVITSVYERGAIYLREDDYEPTNNIDAAKIQTPFSAMAERLYINNTMLEAEIFRLRRFLERID